MVVQSCRPENLPKAVAAFPSAELLDTLIQHFLTSPLPRACSFIHTPTLDPNCKRPELLLAMAAAGAVLTADPTLARLGYAMQECVRVAVPKVWEGDNTQSRSLELTQAYLINLEIGLWSGRGRKVEIAESHLQAILTMFRRDGRFRKSGYHPAKATVLDGPDAQDTGDHQSGTSSSPPETAWRAWVEQESFKRTAFRMVQHDHDSSTYLLTGPLVSYAELTLPLPCAPALWAAATAQQWRQQSLLLLESSSSPPPVGSSSRPLSHQAPPPPPAMADYLGDLATFQSRRANMAADAAFAKDALLACAWSLAWECMQMSALHRSLATADGGGGARGSCLSSPFILTSRRDELLKLLAQFRLVLDTNEGSTTLPPYPPAGSRGGEDEDVAAQVHSTMLSMRLELIQMHLHTPFEEVQVFAGMEGPEHARAAYDALAGWADGADGAGGEGARRAIVHAGRVLHVAKRAPRGTASGPVAVGVYQATLVLWVWSLLAAQRERRGRGQGQGQGRRDGGEEDLADQVCLNGDDHLATQRWTCFGMGKPCLLGGGSGPAAPGRREGEEAVVSLGDPEAALSPAIGILRDNFKGLARPYLVERLLRLMEALQRSAAGPMMEFVAQLDAQP